MLTVIVIITGDIYVVLTYIEIITGDIYAVLTAIVKITGILICSANSYCDNNGEIYM